MDHLYKVYPKTDISGILQNNKRIIDPTVLKLNRKEFIKCMNGGDVYAIVNGEEVLIDTVDYDKAEAMFSETSYQHIEMDTVYKEAKVKGIKPVVEEVKVVEPEATIVKPEPVVEEVKVEPVVEETTEEPEVEKTEVEPVVEETKEEPEVKNEEKVKHVNLNSKEASEHLSNNQGKQNNQPSGTHKKQYDRNNMKASNYSKSNKK